MSTNLEHTKEELQRTVREILRVVWFRRWSFFVPFCLAASVVFFYSHKLPRVYKASTVFERLNTPAINKVLQRQEGPASMEAMRRFMAEDMLGVESMVKVADQLALTANLTRDEDGHLTPASRERRRAIAKRLRNKLNYKILLGEDYLDEVRIDATGDNPELIVRLVNAVRDNYFDARKTRWLGMLSDTRNLYLQRIEDLRSEIFEKEKRIKNLEENYPYVNPIKGSITQDQYTADKLHLDTEKSRVEELSEEIRLLEERLAGMPVPKLLQPELLSNELDLLGGSVSLEVERKRLRNAILKLNNDLTLLLIDRTPKHPDVQELMRRRKRFELELEKLNEALLDGEPSNEQFMENPAQYEVVKRERQDIEHQLRVKRQKLSNAQANVRAMEGRLQAYLKYKEEGFAIWPEYTRLTDDLKTKKKTLYDLQSQENEYARILDINATDQGIKFNIKERAETSRRPVLPKSRSIVVLALAVGLAFGACAVFLREFFDHTFHTANAVSFSLGVPILESIDEILLPADRRRIFIRRLAAIPVACLLLAVVTMAGSLAWLSLEDPPTYRRIVIQATSTWSQIGM